MYTRPVMLPIEKVLVGAFEVNCWIVRGEGSRAIVIDPGADPQAIRDELAAHDLDVAAYMLTHGHVDHVSALEDLLATHPAPVGLHPADAEWAFTEANLLPPFYDAPRRPERIERELADGQTWTDAGLTYTVITTPGHTPGSVCFYFETDRVLVCGDTLFQGSVGRTDLPGGNPRELSRSLVRLAKLPDDTTVYTGHGPPTTLESEKRSNYFMQAACRTA